MTMEVTRSADGRNVKNVALYNALQTVCGEIKVSQEGEPATYTVVRRSPLEPGPDIVFARDVKGGERYIATCPYCGRPKLWVSYLAGAHTTIRGSTVYFGNNLIICYHCEFNKDPTKQTEFWNKMKGVGYDYDRRRLVDGNVRDPMGDGEATTGATVPVVVPNLPTGVVVDLPGCPEKVGSYLRSRGIDPADLTKFAGCFWSPNPMESIRYKAIGRIIFPVYQNKEYVGWQGRALDEDIEDTKYPKYYFPSWFKKERVLYNLDRAKWCDTVVLVEGVFDVYRVGNAGVACFGRYVHPHQLKILNVVWGNRSVVILPDMNDPKAMPDAINRVEDWNARQLFKGGAYVCRLPLGKDPGAMQHADIVQLVQAQTGKSIP